MPHRAKNKHRARHHSQSVKAANLSKPALPLPTEQAPAATPSAEKSETPRPVATAEPAAK